VYLGVDVRMGIVRWGKINSVNSVSDTCTGMGVVAGFLADMGTIE